MLNVISQLMASARDRALYLKTRSEIEHMPLDVALDLGIYRGDADKIARQAVWGIGV